MKKLITITFLNILMVSAYSQNWIPLKSNNKYNYEQRNSNIITNTIWIDSVNVHTGDSVFYLNRIITYCDTCTSALGGTSYPCDTCYELKNQPQFLKRKMVKKNNGDYVFQDTAEFILRTNAHLFDNWIFDTLHNVTAEITDVSQQLIFGNNDSVKTITLSTNDTIKLSENNGIIFYSIHSGLNSVYELKGIEVRNVGEILPDFWAIYNFNVGDIFQYYGDGYNAGGGGFYTKKYTVISKQTVGDSLLYGITGLQKTFDYSSGVSYQTINSTLVYVDSANHPANKYNNEIINIPIAFSQPEFSKLTISYDTNNLITKEYGNSSYDFLYYPLNTTSDILVAQTPIQLSYKIKYTEGLGVVYSLQDDHFENYLEEYLVGYVKSHDTIGVITPDSMLAVIENLYMIENNFGIYPNPGTDNLIIEIGDFKFTNLDLKICDIVGKTVLEKTLYNKVSTIDVSVFAKGMYFVKVKTEKGVTVKKFIKE